MLLYNLRETVETPQGLGYICAIYPTTKRYGVKLGYSEGEHPNRNLPISHFDEEDLMPLN